MGILDGKIVLITGAGQGVGQGIAYAMASEGAKIAVTGRTVSKLDDTVAEIRRRGGTAQAFACEVTAKSDLERCVREVVAAFGGINILVNNAQLVPLGSLMEVTDEAFVEGFDSGPLASLRLMRLCYPYLKGDGVVINLGTGAAYRQDSGRYGAYAAVKEAIRALSRAAACEWGADNIRVNVVIPFALSKGLEGWIAERPEESTAFLNTVPLRRAGDCESDIGRAVVALCGPDSRYITGQTIALDGGQAYLG
ncbi:MAG: 3-oxoacyl-ACP reductase [Rhodospirillales bacterium]|nr:3-oxoacyl-ACP reductase [Rhodospirillales bacterium]